MLRGTDCPTHMHVGSGTTPQHFRVIANHCTHVIITQLTVAYAPCKSHYNNQDTVSASRVCDAIAEGLSLPQEMRWAFGLHFVSNEGSVHRFAGDDHVKGGEMVKGRPHGVFLYSKVTLRAADEVCVCVCVCVCV
jgi:hypothetical protein